MKPGWIIPFCLMCVCFVPVVAAEPERSGPATHFRAQQRDGDGGGEEVPQPQLAQPLPQLEHRRQVRGPGCTLGVGFLPHPPPPWQLAQPLLGLITHLGHKTIPSSRFVRGF